MAAFGSVGLTTYDQNRKLAALDGHGVERSRAWEPTQEAGDFYLRLYESCLRVAAIVYTHGGSTCNVAGELCCDRRYSFYNRVYSLMQGSGTDYLLTTSEAEMQSLLGKGWSQVGAGVGLSVGCGLQYAKPSLCIFSSRSAQGP